MQSGIEPASTSLFQMDILPSGPCKKDKYFFNSDQMINQKLKTNGRIGLFAEILLYDGLKITKNFFFY